MAKQIITLEVEYTARLWEETSYPAPVAVDWESAVDGWLSRHEVGTITRRVRVLQASEVRYDIDEGPDAVPQGNL